MSNVICTVGGKTTTTVRVRENTVLGCTDDDYEEGHIGNGEALVDDLSPHRKGREGK